MPIRKNRSTPSGRRRLPASEARARILATAERRLTDIGPEQLRLTDLAAELGISHQAILHHFGSREELLAAVLAQATERINQRLAEGLSGGSAGEPTELLDMAAEFFADAGRARLFAWLVLSPHASHLLSATEAVRPLQPLVQLVHARRKQRKPEGKVELAESRFLCQLAALTLLGEALFGDLIRLSSGEPRGADRSREFRRRLARLIRDTG